MSAARLALEALGWLAGVWLLWHVPRCRQPSPDDQSAAGAVSVIIPARDEEWTLPRLLASLAAQDAAPAEVIVVDDHSADRTAGVATTAGATVLSAPPLPAGWTGKAWACHQGAAAARTATLVFLDADTELEPGGIGSLVAEHRRRGGLISVAPDHLTERPYERLSAFFNVVSMMGVDAFDPRRERRAPRGAFGPCMVTSAADYSQVGGHEAVRGEVVEDVALARRYTAHGLAVACLGGRGTIRYRMYPGGLGQLVEGWTKNFATGAGATRPATFALVVLWLSGCIMAPWLVGATTIHGDTAGLLVAALVYATYAGQLAWMLERIGRFGWTTAALYPVPLAFFLAVFARSLVRTHVRRQVTWRGRTIATKPTSTTSAGEEAAR